MNTENQAVETVTTTKSRADATEGIYCDHTAKQVVFSVKAGVAGDRPSWQVKETYTIDLDKIPDSLLCNDGTITSLKAYGARALLMDRASDFRKYGASAYLAEMKRVCETLLEAGRFDAERGTGGATPKVCGFLAQALATVKNITVPVATASLASLSKEQREKIAGKLATEITALKTAHKAAVLAAGEVDLSDLY